MKNHIKIIFIICMIYELLTGCSCKTKNGQELLINGGHEQSMGNTITIDKISNNYIKSLHTANPISGEIFCADPTAIEYKGRLYVYATNDHQQYETVGDNGKNDYMHIKSMVVFSTDDMKNWTYHGIIDVESIAPWIINSWAPSIVSRVEEDGLTHFYMYFSNNGCGVGVIT
ncbi:MAG: hypothetical protein N2Z57_04080, partial [Oscillospiraceae bacterium]|nr:hypothetical protein [Oscillospiraceae bacterium]